jgi:hypothetical protein
MDLFVRKHQKKINGTLSCFDRMLFRGYLPIQSGWEMAQFLNQNQISFRRLKESHSQNQASYGVGFNEERGSLSFPLPGGLPAS